MFSPDQKSSGHDLKAWDFQAGYDLQEPAYIDVLRKFYNISKCDDDFVKEDLINHDDTARNIIWKKCNGTLKNIKYSFAVALESFSGNILAPTDSLVILEQMKRTICGDRWWYSNGKVFPFSKF